MTDLRTAAQQALEALEGWENHDRWVWPESALEQAKRNTTEALAALKAALAEPVQQGCNHCNQPLYAAIKCRVCGRKTPIIEPEIKGDNKPVAWIHTDPDKRRVKFLEWRENEPGYRGDWIKTPLYAAPPQRKPLTEEEIKRLVSNDMVQFARAIERAHGIGGQP